MYQLNPFLLESIKLDPIKVDSYLKDPSTRKLLSKIKSRIHKNQYLRDKFYGVHTLYHMTPTINLSSIKEKGIIPSNKGFLTARATDNKSKILPKLVYTMDNPDSLKRYFKRVHDPVERSMIKIRIPESELKLHRVADPLEQVNAPKNFKLNPVNFITKSSLKNYPSVDKLVSDKMASDTEYKSIYDLIDDLYKYKIISGKITPKELRRWWSTQATSRDKMDLVMAIHKRFPRGNYSPNTVALKTAVKPEWIVGSKNANKYKFEDELRKNPEHTISMINDLLKRST